MSGLATVTYTLVLTVMRHGFSPTQPCITRLGPALSIMTVNAWSGVLMCPPFSTGTRSFPDSWPSLPSASLLFLSCHSVFLTGFRASPRSFVTYSMPLVIFYLLPVRTVTPELPWLPTSPARRLSLVPLPGLGQSAPPECPGTHFLWPGC
jgi:hypothetical protein